MRAISGRELARLEIENKSALVDNFLRFRGYFFLLLDNFLR